ncbi:hypothetical protein Tco_1266685, partial [Tanacetum coccineum]
MAESSSPEITPKEEHVTLDKPESPNPFLAADQVEFTFEEIALTANNEVALLYPSHQKSDYFKVVSDFISKCCLREAFTRAPTQYKEYLCEFWYTTKTLNESKIWVSTPNGSARPSCLDINQLIKLLGMEIKILEDLNDILTKLKTLTSSVSSLLSQVAELKTLKWKLPAEFLALPSHISSVHAKLQTLDSLPSPTTASPAEGEKNTNPATTDAETTNLHNELVDLLGIDIVKQYYNKKLLYEKYCDKMLKRR